jgi:hypothetical protein
MTLSLHLEADGEGVRAGAARRDHEKSQEIKK